MNKRGNKHPVCYLACSLLGIIVGARLTSPCRPLYPDQLPLLIVATGRGPEIYRRPIGRRSP
jgi:hypothetical protein